MDPNLNLREQEFILTNGTYRIDEARRRSDRLFDLRLALTNWIDKGGFEPDWAACPIAAKYYGK